MSKFLENIARLRDTATTFAAYFNVPGMRSLVLKTRSETGYELFDMGIAAVEELSPSLDGVEGISGLRTTTEVFNVTGISHARFSRQQLEAEGTEFFLDGVIKQEYVPDEAGGYTTTSTVEGIPCHLVGLTENTLTWDLQIQKNSGNSALY